MSKHGIARQSLRGLTGMHPTWRREYPSIRYSRLNGPFPMQAVPPAHLARQRGIQLEHSAAIDAYLRCAPWSCASSLALMNT